MRKISLECPTADLREYRKLAELAKELGATHLSASQIEPSMWQWNVNRYDPYPNWSLHRPTVFKYIVPEALKPYLPADYAKRNLDTLAERVAILKEFGLKATFAGMEPAYLPEAVYRDHPSWRGPRCDQARRARTEYYAPCIDNPEVREMYVNAVAELCKVAPFEHFQLLTNDSGGGLCWNDRLYPGKNGPLACKHIPIGERVVNFLSIFQEGARIAGYEAEVNVRNILDHDAPAVLPLLKPGQSINNRTLEHETFTEEVGFRNCYLEFTTPVARLSRMGHIAEQLQKVQAAQDHNLLIALRDPDETDTIAFVKKYLGRMPEGIVGRYTALTDMAADFVGPELADKLVRVWDLIEKVNARFDHLESGGHIFTLGTVHQRWLVRPFVAFPGELKPEEKNYYREFQFQAQSEEDADNMLDLQAHRWIGGYSGQVQLEKSVNAAMPQLNQAIALMRELSETAGTAQDYLKSQLLKLKLYRCIIRNANNVCKFQTILDRTDYSEEPKDTSLNIWEQGDIRYFKVNEIMREEIDNTLEIISLLEQAETPILQTAPSTELETVMTYAPNVVENLKKKIAIMENHRRDFTRLYKSYNR